jgi:signal transduction histidine kinase
MALLRHLPIRRKLALIAMVTTGGALLLAGAALVYFDLARFRSEMTSDLTTLADIVAENSTAALTFHYQADAGDILRALRLQDSIIAAALYDAHGRLFASYAPQSGTIFPPRPGPDGARLEPDGVVVFRPVMQGEERIGSVYLRSGLDELLARIRAQAVSVGTVFLAAGILALLLSSGLQRLVSRPLLNLARTARAVSERRDYSLRAEKLGDDELGRLVDAFNDMLGQIQDRDTELRRAKDERERLLALEQRARRQAEEANRLKDEFLATLSHELRTPLNAILGWVQVLRTGKLDEAAAAKALETIERNARAQAQLIGDLLDVSRIITGKLRLDFKPVELHRVIDAALESVQPAADAKGIRLAVNLGALAFPVLGDSDRLQQVVWNLLSNGIKFTPRGGRVEVLLRESAGNAVIQVSDSGIGIRPDFLPFVFDRFRQAEGSITRSHTGLGLGLSIVRHMVELHGGTVAVDSAGEGQGSTFTVQLPMRAELTEGLPFVDRRRGAGSSPVASLPDLLKDLRVLVVEDEKDTRDLLEMALRQCGAEVSAYGSVPEALAAFDRLPPDVVVSDIGIPEEDGYSLIQKIRSRDPGSGGMVPAAALTAYARTEDRLRALEAGFQKHLAKPLDPAELVAAVASLAGR